MDAAAGRALEAEGWRADWGGEALAAALAERFDNKRFDNSSGAAAAAGRQLGAADVRAVLLDTDLRKVGLTCACNASCRFHFIAVAMLKALAGLAPRSGPRNCMLSPLRPADRLLQ